MPADIATKTALPGGLASYFRDHPDAMPLRAGHSIRMEDGSYHVTLSWVVDTGPNTGIIAAEMNLDLVMPWGSKAEQQGAIYDQAIAIANAWNWARHEAMKAAR